MSEWRDISTAPKDKLIWAWPCEFEDGNAVTEAHWYVHQSVQGWITDDLDCAEFDFSPTHWRPWIIDQEKPAPPTPTGSKPPA